MKVCEYVCGCLLLFHTKNKDFDETLQLFNFHIITTHTLQFLEYQVITNLLCGPQVCIYIYTYVCQGEASNVHLRLNYF